MNSRKEPATDAASATALETIVPGVWHDLRHGVLQFVAFDLLFKVVAIAIVTPIATWLVTRLISTSGQLSLSNDQILSFALSPVGLLALLFASTVTFTLGFAEQSGIVVMGTRALSGERISFLEGGWYIRKRLLSILGLAALLALLYGVALAPFGALAALTYQLLLTRYDINYVITERPMEFWVSLVIGVILVAGAGLVFVRLYLRWIFSVAAVILDRHKPVSALRISWHLMEGQWKRVGGIFLVWGLIMAIVPVVITSLAGWAGDIVLARFGGRAAADVMIGLVMMVYLLALGIATFVALVINGLLIARLYHGIAVQKGLDVASLPQPRADGLLGTLSPARLRIMTGVAVAVILLLAAIFSAGTLKGLGLDYDVYVTAHRGSSTRAPENSLSAIRIAIEEGADFAEIDVQETADGVVVLLHDTDLMRIAGLDRMLADVTYDEIEDLDAGSWFSEEYAGERIPTLAEAIEVAHGRIGLQVELKFTGEGYGLAERVVQVIRENDFVSQAQIVSLDYAGVSQVEQRYPEFETGYIVFRAVGNIARLDIDFLSINKSMATEDVVASAHRAEKELHVWTANSRDEMFSLIDLGVDGILTDEPALLREVIDERASLSEAEKLLLAFQHWLHR